MASERLASPLNVLGPRRIRAPGIDFYTTGVLFYPMHIALRYLATVLVVALAVRLVRGVSYVDYTILALVALVWSILM